MIDENRLIEVLEKNFYGTGGVEVLKQIINEQPKVNEWIPCNERLPEEREFVILLAKNHGMDIGCLTDNEWYCSGYELSLNKIIAWMPLPEPFKGETE